MAEGNVARETQTDSRLDRDALEFHFREHASLRAEIESDKQHLRKLEIYTVIGAGSVWAWLALNSPVELRFGWFIPAVLGCFGLFQTLGVVRDIRVRAEYLQCVEKEVRRLNRLEGWETFLHKRRRIKNPAVLNCFFWLVYLAVAISVPCLVL